MIGKRGRFFQFNTRAGVPDNAGDTDGSAGPGAYRLCGDARREQTTFAICSRPLIVSTQVSSNASIPLNQSFTAALTLAGSNVTFAGPERAVVLW